MLVARVDEAAVQQWYRADPAEPGQPPAGFRYPPAGSANAAVSLWIADLAGPPGAAPTAVDWDTAGFEYLTAAGWDESGPYAAVQRRDQQHVQVLGIDPATGATRVLAEQRDDAWVQLVPGLPARTASGVLLTSTDTGGTRRLVADGRPVTPPGLQLGEVLAADGETVLFAASGEPTRRTVGLSPRGRAAPGELGTGGARGHRPRRHRGPGLAGAGPFRFPDHGPASRRGGQRGGTGAAGDRLGRGGPRPGVPGRDPLAGAPAAARRVFLPSWHQAGDGPLPVLMDPYGGPALRKVTVAAGWTTCVSQWFASKASRCSPWTAAVPRAAGPPGNATSTWISPGRSWPTRWTGWSRPRAGTPPWI